MNSGPAPYSATDTAEVSAVRLVEQLIDGNKAKCHINTRDKVPNLDGFIELIDEFNRPIGKIDVQVKKLPDDASSVSVSVELVNYSKTTTQPFIFLAADLKNKRVFWKHVRREMPEFRPDQGSFTIKFSELDLVDVDGHVYGAWRRITADYQQRISGYPRLKELSESPTAGILPEFVQGFQEFVDRINTLWDNDFPAIKERLYADVWKFGIGIYNAQPQCASFSIYSIPRGASAPLLKRIERDELRLPNDLDRIASPNAGKITNIQVTFTQGRSVLELLQNADKFVFEKVDFALKRRLLPLYGLDLYREVLWDFVDNRFQSLGIRRSESYRIEDLQKQFRLYTQKNLQRATALMSPGPDHCEILSATENSNLAETTSFSFREPGYRHIFDAIDHLESAGETELANPYRVRTLPSKNIWEGFAPEALLHNLSAVLTVAPREYRSFIEGNNLNHLRSTLVGKEEAVIYLTGPSVWKSMNGLPYLHRCVVPNHDHAIPDVVLVDSIEILSDDWESVTLNGRKYEVLHYVAEGCKYLFHNLPLQRYIYRLFLQGINEVYGQKLRDAL